jgi:hypothetical protein
MPIAQRCFAAKAVAKRQNGLLVTIYTAPRLDTSIHSCLTLPTAHAPAAAQHHQAASRRAALICEELERFFC